MKSIVLFITFLLCYSYSISQEITRGPDIGEIYFLGPTHTGTGLYYSTDFGESAVCVDSTMDILTIAGDKTSGGLYCVEMPSNLYYSDNYGYSNSWEVKNGGISVEIESGINPGHIFSSFYMHSEDYGSNFIYHTCNGYFGNKKNYTFDNADDNIGYVLSNKLTVADTVYFFRTYDTFENLELLHTLNYHWNESIELLRGFNSGELYFFNHTRNELWFSNNYADSLELLNIYNFNNYYQFSSDGGKQDGEFFILYNFVNLMWQNAHVYIYHSTDYGITFEVFHPFAKGNEPILANFSTINHEGNQPLEVEFCNYSIGEVLEYQWDFENDGEIDSYEQSPNHIYPDTGLYSVNLTIVGSDSSNSFLRENYIHVKKLVNINENISMNEIKCYPNPFENSITISSINPSEFYTISIYNLKGSKVFEVYHQDTELIINTVALNSGVYIINLSSQYKSTNYKIIKK
jgi:PKD repeat protein